MSSPPRINRRVITGKGRTITDWWAPVDEWLNSKAAPIFKEIEINPLIEPFSKHLRISPDDVVLVAPRGGADGGGIAVTIVLLSRDPKTNQTNAISLASAVLDTVDGPLAWRICALLDNLLNGVPLDPDHQDELESLLFSV